MFRKPRSQPETPLYIAGLVLVAVSIPVLAGAVDAPGWVIITGGLVAWILVSVIAAFALGHGIQEADRKDDLKPPDATCDPPRTKL